LAVEREEIFTRMNMLNNEGKKFKQMYLRLEQKYDEQTRELEAERERAL
jgi:nitrate/nitrite-specific signal transduction histidine kinase